MKLDNTKSLLSHPLEGADPREVLLDVLRAAVELLSIEDNDFAWSSWKDSSAAVAEVSRLLAIVEAGGIDIQTTLEIVSVYAF